MHQRRAQVLSGCREDLDKSAQKGRDEVKSGLPVPWPRESSF